MYTKLETSDSRLLDLIRLRGSMTVSEISTGMEVTATATRQRLSRLMGQGLISRQEVVADASKGKRGRPSHKYALTEQARLRAGTNFSDLAEVLWEEVHSVKDPEVRKGLLSRLATRLAKLYQGRTKAGASLTERMESVRELFAEREIPMRVDSSGAVPLLQVLDCPYPGLAERDRGICAAERMLFAEMLESPLRLTECRLEGHACCVFEPSQRELQAGTSAVS